MSDQLEVGATSTTSEEVARHISNIFDSDLASNLILSGDAFYQNLRRYVLREIIYSYALQKLNLVQMPPTGFSYSDLVSIALECYKLVHLI